jgi:hypothetical protein
MSDNTTVTYNDPTASEGPYRINPPGERGGLEMPTGLERGASLGDRARGDPTPGSTRLQKELEGELSASEQEHQDIVSRRNAAYSELHRREAQRPRIPTQQQLGPPPDAKEYQKHTMAWAGAMAMIGALSAKAGRMSGQQAMDSFSGALKGWHEGNLEAYTNAVEKWQNTNAQTLENNRQLMEKYQLVLDNHRMNIDQQMMEIERISVENRDNMVYRLSREKNMTAIAQLQDYRQGANEKLKRSAETLQAKVDKDKLTAEETAIRYGPFAGPNGEIGDRDPLTGRPLSNQQQQTIKYAINNYGPGGAYKPGSAADIIARKEALLGRKLTPDEEIDVIHQMRPQTQPRSAPAMALNRYMQEHPGATSEQIKKFSADYANAVSRARSLGVKGGNIDTATEEAIRASKLALNASDEVPRGKWTPINVWKQKGLRAASNPEMKNFDLKNSALITAYANTMSRTGVTTVEAQKRAEFVLNTADGPEAYRAGVEALLQEMANVQQAVRDVESGVADEGTSPSGATPTSGGGIQIKNKQEYDALPKGTTYIAPDGSVRTKS